MDEPSAFVSLNPYGNLLHSPSAFVALMEVAESAGVVEAADFTAEAYDAADAFDGEHERRVVETDAAGVALEEGEEQLLLADVPAAVAGREAVGVVPVELVDACLQAVFHLVGTLFGYDGA